MSAHSIRRIESDDNRVYKQLVQTLSSRGIRKYDRAIVSGAKMVADVLRTSPAIAEAWIGTPNHDAPPAELPARAVWYQLAPPLFRALDVSGTDTPLLWVAVPELSSWSLDELGPGCTLLVPFQDPENVGAVIRSAVAFGATEVVLLAEAAHPYHPKSVRASGGAVFGATLRRGPSLDELPGDESVVSLSSEGVDVSRFAFPSRFALLPGMEGPGLPERFRARALSIPMSSKVESLNAAAAAAIAMYVWSRATR